MIEMALSPDHTGIVIVNRRDKRQKWQELIKKAIENKDIFPDDFAACPFQGMKKFLNLG